MGRNRKFIPGNIINGYKITKVYDKTNTVKAVCLKCGKETTITKTGIYKKSKHRHCCTRFDVGDKINSLTYIGKEKSGRYDSNYGLFKCYCGNTKAIRLDQVREGYIKDCGCGALKKIKPNPNNKSTGLRNIYPCGNSYKIIIRNSCVGTPLIKCRDLDECVKIRDYLKGMDVNDFIEFCTISYDAHITVRDFIQFESVVHYFLNS